MKYLLFTFFLILNSFYFEIEAQKLNPGDGVRIIFLDIADPITGDYYIQPDSKLQLPYIGVISTLNKQFAVLENEIHSKYDSLYRNPELNILCLFKINILGEVYKPGYYYVSEEQKLTDVLASAGGATGSANLQDVSIIRNGQEISLDVENIMQEGDTNANVNIQFQSGDQIYIPRSFWADPARFTWIFTALATVVTIVAIFIVN